MGASAGALIATIAACDVDPEHAVEAAYKWDFISLLPDFSGMH